MKIKGLSTVAEETWVVVTHITDRVSTWKRVVAWAVVPARIDSDEIEPVVLSGALPVTLSEFRSRINGLSPGRTETVRILRSSEESHRLLSELGPEHRHYGDVGHP